MTGTSHEDICTFMTNVAEFFLEWETISEEFVAKLKTRTVYSITFFSENYAVYDIMRKNMVDPGRTQMPTKYGECALHAG